MDREHKGWEIYERMIARLVANEVSTELCVTANAWVTGRITGDERQLDALIEARHDTDNSRRIVVDAKNRKRKVDVKEVEAFLGLMQDVKATHGYLVTSSGYSKAAEKRAQKAASIRIVPVDRLANFDPSSWPKCKDADCKGGRVFWDGYPELSLKLCRVSDHSDARTVKFVHYVGKCDRCGLFHVWCTRCNEIMAVPHESEQDFGHQCRCRLPWFWLASVEQDEDGVRSAELHIVRGNGLVDTVDRRSL
jgi:Restriction endonuclease